MVKGALSWIKAFTYDINELQTAQVEPHACYNTCYYTISNTNKIPVYKMYAKTRKFS